MDRDRIYQADKVRKATRQAFPVRRGNWIERTGLPPICSMHDEEAFWQRNKARVSGGQWTCRTCARLKSKGLRRAWRTEHTDPFKYNVMRFFTMAKHHSKKVGREFAISFDDILSMWDDQSGRCAVSGIEMEFLPGDGMRRRNKVTMDRIDSSKGYVKGNVWLVTDWVNRAKSDLSKEELLLFAGGILTIRRRL